MHISMQSVYPLSQQKPGIWATETMAAQGNGTEDLRHRQPTDISYQLVIKLAENNRKKKSERGWCGKGEIFISVLVTLDVLFLFFFLHGLT